MRRVVVGIAGGTYSGKTRLVEQLAKRLRSKAVEVITLEHKNKLPDIQNAKNSECVLIHGLTVLEDPKVLPQLDVKVYLDVDSDMRLAKSLEQRRRLSKHDYCAQREFHVNHVMKQRKVADIWMEDISAEKIEWLSEIIMKARKNTYKEEEPIEVAMFLDKHGGDKK